MTRAWLSLLFASFLIKTQSLERLKPFLIQRKMSCKEAWSLEEAEQAFLQIEQAKRFFISRTACLEQSLALFLFATSQGKSIDWCVGIRLAPFASHAWVEAEGITVRELESVQKYRKIVEI
ncbi:ATP-binding cassette subfamily B protein [Croceifilum oryzae]|uniref:ATP-binding cassette subfamily B protein n=1 Tax=Croceifilum oryzae TaxID=1553429 RepID=A0AAJ1TLH1_9BACL|nr:lasso peptide biosynthesis B2 protein [Croceifilum oryzae]MDQ0418146.1 ATP-binding cassette subfamily B protein [Croceifilum oryzae]